MKRHQALLPKKFCLQSGSQPTCIEIKMQCVNENNWVFKNLQMLLFKNSCDSLVICHCDMVPRSKVSLCKFSWILVFQFCFI